MYRNGKKLTGERQEGTVLCTTVFSNCTATGASEEVRCICHAVHHSLTLCLYYARVKHFTITRTLTQKLYFKSHRMVFNLLFLNMKYF